MVIEMATPNGNLIFFVEKYFLFREGPAAIQKWLARDREPTFEQIKQVAHAQCFAAMAYVWFGLKLRNCWLARGTYQGAARFNPIGA